jgi:peroxiredoxin
MKPLLALLLLLSVIRLHAVDLPGLKVGDPAPDFALTGSVSEPLSLASLRAQGPVALVFVRSADWCPFCRNQLTDLQAALKDLEATGLRLVAVSYDAPATNAAVAAKLGLTYPLLSDVGSKVIDAYGIRNHEAKGRGEGIPHPVVFIVDRDGVIRAKLAREGYRDRPESAEIIAAAKILH